MLIDTFVQLGRATPTYDNDEDIPRLSINGETIKVETVIINKEATKLSVQTRDGDYSLSLVPTGKQTPDDIESILNESKVPDLLQEVYYETDESYEIGDFETDFLNE